MTNSNDIQGFDRWQAVFDVLCKFGGSLLYNDSKGTHKWTLWSDNSEILPTYSETEIRCAIVRAFDIVKRRQLKDRGVSADECLSQLLSKVEIDNIIENLRSEAWFTNGATALNMSKFILETE